MGPQPSLQKKGSNPCPAEAEQKSTAFRKLFDEEEDQVMAETSPQFKKIWMHQNDNSCYIHFKFMLFTNFIVVSSIINCRHNCPTQILWFTWFCIVDYDAE